MRNILGNSVIRISVPILLFMSLMGCKSSTQEISISSSVEEEIEMKLIIDNQNIEVSWLNNESVDDLKSLATNELTISMHQFGGFEQTGPIGSSIRRNDIQMDVVPGDIVLYQGNQISVFYNPSAWSYTKLGHIEMSQDALKDLLEKESVTFILTTK